MRLFQHSQRGKRLFTTNLSTIVLPDSPRALQVVIICHSIPCRGQETPQLLNPKPLKPQPSTLNPKPYGGTLIPLFLKASCPQKPEATLSDTKYSVQPLRFSNVKE